MHVVRMRIPLVTLMCLPHCASATIGHNNVPFAGEGFNVRILHERRGILHVPYMCITFALTQLYAALIIIQLYLKLLYPICLYVVTYQVLHALIWKRRNLYFSSYGEQTYILSCTYVHIRMMAPWAGFAPPISG